MMVSASIVTLGYIKQFFPITTLAPINTPGIITVSLPIIAEASMALSLICKGLKCCTIFI